MCFFQRLEFRIAGNYLAQQERDSTQKPQNRTRGTKKNGPDVFFVRFVFPFCASCGWFPLPLGKADATLLAGP